MILTGRQIRKARALLDLSQAELAAAAGVAVSLIARVEASDSMAIAKKRDLGAIRRVLKDAGVEFIPENGGGAGVRLRKGVEASAEGPKVNNG